MTFTPIKAIASTDPEVNYILRLEAKLEADFAASETIFTESDIEVDSDADEFGLLYRVWKGTKRLGNFYRSPVDDLWVAEPFCCNDRNRYETADQAQAAVVAAWS